MYIGSQQVDQKIQCMSHNKHQDEYDGSSYTASHHASHRVDNGSNNAGGKSQSQQSGVGQYVAEPTGHIVQIVCTQRDPEYPVLIGSSRHETDADCASDGHHLRQCTHKRREGNMHLGNGCKHGAWQEHEDQSHQENRPQSHIAKGIQIFLVPDEHICFYAKTQEHVDQAEQHGIHQHLHGVIQGNEPQWLDGHLFSKEYPGHYIHHVSKIAAEHDTPEYRGQSAVQEHPKRFLHAVTHTRELLQHHKTRRRNDQAVCRIRKHQSEQENVTPGHDRSRVDLSFARKPERLHHTFKGRRQCTVLHENWGFLILGDLRHLHRQSECFIQLFC